MAWYVLLGTLAAFGAFSALWAVLGWLLPKDKGCVFVCCGQPDEGTRTWIKWLRGSGLVNAPMLIVLEESTDELEICSWGSLRARLEWEKKQSDGTGNGDYSGNHQCGGLPEL